MVSEEVYKQIGHTNNSRPDQTGECLLNDGLPQPLHVVLRFDGVSYPLLLLHVETGVAALERNEQVGDQQGAVFGCHCGCAIAFWLFTKVVPKRAFLNPGVTTSWAKKLLEL